MPAKPNMTDREYMDDILLTSKVISNLYHYAVQESSTDELHYQFKDILNQSLEMQHQVFSLMQQKGWYNMQPAEQQKINQTKSSFQQS
jgi:spore coat protein CotF